MKVVGKNGVKELLLSNVLIQKILIDKEKINTLNDILDLARAKKVDFEFVPRVLLDKESNFHQGVLAITLDYEYATIDEILDNKKEHNFILILDGILDPQNLGAIIRVGECMGVDGIVIAKHRACQVTDAVVRASAGAFSHVKIARVNNINDTIKLLKDKNIWVYAIELLGKPIDKIDFTGNVAIVLGSEGNGVSMLTKKICDDVASINMYGKINSLNVSNACAIALYEINKQTGK